MIDREGAWREPLNQEPVKLFGRSDAKIFFAIPKSTIGKGFASFHDPFDFSSGSLEFLGLLDRETPRVAAVATYRSLVLPDKSLFLALSATRNCRDPVTCALVVPTTLPSTNKPITLSYAHCHLHFHHSDQDVCYGSTTRLSHVQLLTLRCRASRRQASNIRGPYDLISSSPILGVDN